MSENMDNFVTECEICINGFVNAEDCQKHMEAFHSALIKKSSSPSEKLKVASSKVPLKPSAPIKTNSRPSRDLSSRAKNSAKLTDEPKPVSIKNSRTVRESTAPPKILPKHKDDSKPVLNKNSRSVRESTTGPKTPTKIVNCSKTTPIKTNARQVRTSTAEPKTPPKPVENSKPTIVKSNSRSVRELIAEAKVAQKLIEDSEPVLIKAESQPTSELPLDNKISTKPVDNSKPSSVRANSRPARALKTKESNIKLEEKPNKATPKKRKAGISCKVAIRIYNDDENPFKCNVPLCLCQFKTRVHLEYHLKCHNIKDSNYKCPECSEMFYIWRSLRVHLRKVHEIEIEVYSCEYCGENFDFKYRLMEHKQIHSWEYPFVCENCGKTFEQYQDWYAHEASHRVPIKKNFKCNICNQAFTRKKSLAFHKRTRHGEGRPHFCNNCGHAARSDAALKEHVCEGEKWFKCEQCLYCTWNYKLFHRHTMKHMGVRQFRCSQCLCVHQDLKSYLQHFIQLHPGEVMVLICPMCPFTGEDQLEFQNHIDDHQRGLEISSLEKDKEDLAEENKLTTDLLLESHPEIKNEFIDANEKKTNMSDSEQMQFNTTPKELDDDCEIMVVQEVFNKNHTNVNNLPEKVIVKNETSPLVAASSTIPHFSLSQTHDTPPPPTLPRLPSPSPSQNQMSPNPLLPQSLPSPSTLSPSAPLSPFSSNSTLISSPTHHPESSKIIPLVPDTSQKYVIQPNPETGVWSLVPVNQLVTL